MAKADLSEYTRKYEIFRHHAWAGTAFLSILLALRYFITAIPRFIFIPLGTLLIVYILICVLYTYRYYRAGLSNRGESDRPTQSTGRPGGQTVAPESPKIEKKRAKSEAKARKKEQKSLTKTSNPHREGS
jgi:hypothetical protein